MASSKKLELTALLGLVLQGFFAAFCYFLGGISHSRAVAAEFWHVVPGLLVWSVVLFHGRQRRLAEQEREDLEQLRGSRLSDEIFAETELDTMRASSGLHFFEKFVVPAASVAFSGLMGFLAYHIASEMWSQEAWDVSKPELIAATMALMSFFGFLVGTYASGLARNRGYRLLRAGGGYMLGNAVMSLLLVVSMTLFHFDILWGERVLTYLIPCVMALVGVEVLLNLLLDIYRPRVEGQEARPAYDSRLVGVFAEPGGVLRTVASTLDYQFGFKVSETWFYRFMARAILPLALVQVLSLWLLSGLVVVDQDEIAFVERFGRPYLTREDGERGLQATVLHPGLHLKLPWPFSVTRHVPAYEVLRTHIGREEDEQHRRSTPDEIEDHDDYILWALAHGHGREINFLAPSTVDLSAAGSEGLEYNVGDETPPVNLVRLSAWVHYRVKRKPDGSVDENAAFTYHFQETDIREHVEKLAYRAICRIAAGQDFIKWIAEERGATVNEFGRMVQEAFDEAGLDLEVIAANIPCVHPPTETAGAFEAVVMAMEDKEAKVHEADQESIRLVTGAKAAKEEAIRGADGWAYRHIKRTEAEALHFKARLRAFRQAPSVYAYRTFLSELERALAGQKVVVVPLSERDVLQIDTQDTIKSGLLDDLAGVEEPQ